MPSTRVVVCMCEVHMRTTREVGFVELRYCVCNGVYSDTRRTFREYIPRHAHIAVEIRVVFYTPYLVEP